MKKHYAWVIAFTGTLVLLISHGFGRMSYSILLPPIREALGLTYTQVGLIGTGNFIGYLCLAIVGGFLAARFGARKVISVSLVIIGISLVLTGLSNSFTAAFLMRLVTGMGTGGAYIPMMALPAAWFVASKRGLATGINTVGTGLGLSITGLVLPLLIVQYGASGWRYSWYLMGAIAFICAFICYILLRDNPAEKGLSMYGGDEARGAQEKSQKFSFIKTWLSIAREREVWKLGSVYFMNGVSYIIYLTFFIAFLTQELGLSTKSAGGIFAITGFLSIFSGIVWGSVSDVLGRRYGAMLAYVVLAVSFLLPAFLHETIYPIHLCHSLWHFHGFAAGHYGCRCGRHPWAETCLCRTRSNYCILRCRPGPGPSPGRLDKGCDRDIYLRLYVLGWYFLRRSVAFAHDEEEGPESFMRI